METRDVEVPDAYTLTGRFENIEEKLFAFWDKELQDILVSKTHLELWIQDCHKRRDTYAESYGFSHAMDVQYRLVEQLSQSEYYGTPEMLSTEAATLFEIYQRFINHCRSLHPSLQDPALLLLVNESVERETIIKLKDVSEVAFIRTLFTQLSNLWQRIAVIHAITYNCGYAIEAYLDTGFDVNQQIAFGISFLHLAVGCWSQDTVLLLIERGADVLAIDSRNGRSALHYATSVREEGFMRLLLDSAPSDLISLADKWDKTALDIAREKGFDGCIEILEKAMAR